MTLNVTVTEMARATAMAMATATATATAGCQLEAGKFVMSWHDVLLAVVVADRVWITA